MPESPICALLLSDKSSGSSIVQTELAKSSDVRSIRYTPFQEHETLYWMMATAALGLPQVRMAGSVVPFSAEKARTGLRRLLRNNVPGWEIPADDRRLVFEGWRALCREFSPVFFEKSPHHLHSRSALELILRARREMPDVRFRIIGLVRNPMATLYSAWRRWRLRPEPRQYEWLRAYENLSWLAAHHGDAMMVVRYEDLVEDPAALHRLCEFIGVERDESIGAGLRADAVHRWRSDRAFGFRLSEDVRRCAARFGYREEEMVGSRRLAWPVRSRILSVATAARRSAGRMRRRVPAMEGP